MKVLSEGCGELIGWHDPDEHRAWVRENKSRDLKDKRMTIVDAVEEYVPDGALVALGGFGHIRVSMAGVYEIIRQRKKNLWVCAKFTWSDVTLLVAGGCVSKVDVGWLETGPVVNQALQKGEIELIEWSNGALSYRLLAGAMGVPFLPMRYLGGTDAFARSGAKLIEDPYMGNPICVVPALNPDVGIIHVHQCDVYGNARVFGAGVAPLEIAMASKKLIISTEEIIENEAIRRQPQRTTIPYYFVDAVVVAPFGTYPGSVPGLYSSDIQHMLEFVGAQAQGKMDEYLEKWVYGVASHEEMLEQRVGVKKLLQLRQEETIREGYYE